MVPGERYLCDGVYQYLASSKTPNGLNNYDQYMKKVARAHYETVNGWFKQWGAILLA